jgi:lauroyl/myristoyl acyltransferase
VPFWISTHPREEVFRDARGRPVPERLARRLRKLPEPRREIILQALAGVQDLDKFTPPRRPKPIELADLYRVPLWVLTKVLYTFASIPLLFRLATLRGTIDSFFSRDRGPAFEALERQLGQTTSAAELRRIARRHFQFRRRALLAKRWPLIRDFADADRIEVEGLHLLDEALAGGKGAILVTSYFGCGRLIKPILRSRGRSALLVGDPPLPMEPRQKRLPPRTSGSTPVRTAFARFVHNRVLRLPRASSRDQRWLSSMGGDLPPQLNLRPHLAALARNETLIVVADGRSAEALWRVPVLGVDMYFAPGPVSMARASGAPLLPAFVVDDLEDRGPIGLRLIIHPPLELQVSADAKSDLKANLGQFAAALEASKLWGAKGALPECG